MANTRNPEHQATNGTSNFTYNNCTISNSMHGPNWRHTSDRTNYNAPVGPAPTIHMPPLQSENRDAGHVRDVRIGVDCSLANENTQNIPAAPLVLHAAERQQLVGERQLFALERQHFAAERQRFAAEREQLAVERVQLAIERQQFVEGRDADTGTAVSASTSADADRFTDAPGSPDRQSEESAVY